MTNPLPTQARLSALISTHCDRAGATLPMLHAIQDSYGYVPDEASAGRQLQIPRLHCRDCLYLA